MAKKKVASSMPSYVSLPGSGRKLLPNSRPAGSIDPNEIATLTVRVRSAGDVGELEKKVHKLYSQPLKSRKYLSRDELLTNYGARADDLDAIEHYAQKHNLRVARRSAAQRAVILTGRLGDMLNAFRADVHLFHHAAGSYRGRQGEIMIPKELEPVITGIFGFDTRRKHKSPFRRRLNAAAGPNGSNGVVPTVFAKRYNFPAKQQGIRLDGSGQCIGIIELGGGFNNSDLQLFFKEVKTDLPNVVAVSVDGAANHPTLTGNDDGEVMLDIEVAGAVAPKARLAVYFAPNQGNGFFDAINAAVHDHERNPSVLSISWGGPESSNEEQTIRAFHEVFVEAAALGVTICTATGDHGTADLDSLHWDGNVHVDHPSVDDMVLACGGTQVDAQNRDVVWNDGKSFSTSNGGWATGGGVSEIIPKPDYQKNANVPGSIVDGKAGRGIPDIAMSATDYFTRVQGAEGAGGGTSAVAPLMASLVALLNQAKHKNVGFLNPFLYANADKGIFNDVTKGSNAISNTIQGYTAEVGWDACTGWGTPDGAAILAKL